MHTHFVARTCDAFGIALIVVKDVSNAKSSNRRTGRLCNPQMKGQEDFIQALYFLANNAIEQDCSRANTLLLQLHPMKRTVKVISKKVH